MMFLECISLEMSLESGKCIILDGKLYVSFSEIEFKMDPLLNYIPGLRIAEGEYSRRCIIALVFPLDAA
jgi:hypothetical protein